MRCRSIARSASSCTCSALALLAFAGLGGVAPVTEHDRFQQSAIDQATWVVHEAGGVTVEARNRRLEFTAQGVTTPMSFAALTMRDWGADWRHDFVIDMDYVLDRPIEGDRDIALGVGLAFAGEYPTNFTGYRLGVLRNASGMRLEWGSFTDGVRDDGASILITATDSHLVVTWDREAGRLTARVGTQAISIDHVFDTYGELYGSLPMKISIGCVTLDDTVHFTGSRVALDNFRFTGVEEPRQNP
jgi:hypothetical protein